MGFFEVLTLTKEDEHMKALFLGIMIACFTALFSWNVNAIQDESLVLYLPFDEGEGTNTRDLSLNGHTTTLVGKGVKWVNGGKFANALEFTGFKGHVEVADHDNLSLDIGDKGSFTIMAWIFPKVVNKEFYSVIDKTYFKEGGLVWDNTPTYRLSITNKNQLAFQSRAENATGNGPEIQPNKWYHVAGVQDDRRSNKRVLYVNGESAEEIDLVPKVDAKETGLKIGGRNWVGGGVQQWFKGIIDEVALYSTALTEGEIKRAMRGSLKRFYAVDASGKIAVTWGEIKAGD